MPVARRPDGAVTAAETAVLFDGLAAEPALVLAVSGGPDSTALLHLMARWRAGLRAPPHLVAVTVDHGLRPEGRHEAAAVKRLAQSLAVEHATLAWKGPKPATGIQEAARQARYRLLHAAARRAGAGCVVTAHTLDDQAETVLFRLARGSGLSGIAAMAREVPLTVATAAAGTRRRDDAADGVRLVRPLLDIPKMRLIATLQDAGLAWAEDPGNSDPRFTRARLRGLMPALAGEGLTPLCLARLARRVRRSEAALEAFAGSAAASLGGATAEPGTRVVWNSSDWHRLPEEIALRLLGRAVAAVGSEGPVEFGKLEVLYEALAAAVAGGAPRFRRTLAGAMVSLQRERVIIEGAPARRGPHPSPR